jgi:hypothetical protein
MPARSATAEARPHYATAGELEDARTIGAVIGEFVVTADDDEDDEE